MYCYKKRPPRYLYLICLADEYSLPVFCCEKLAEVIGFLGCKGTTASLMVNHGLVYKGYVCERVFL